MKIFFLCIFFTCFWSFAFSQISFTQYYDEDGQIVEKAKSFYYEVGIKVPHFSSTPKRQNSVSQTDIQYTYHYIDTVKTYYSVNKKLKSVIVYDEKGMRQGEYIEFYENGKIKEKAKFIDNRKDISRRWYDSGKPYFTIKYLSPATSDFAIIDYWSPTGIQFVNGGTGVCVCDFNPEFQIGLLEKGKVVNGLRDSIWFGHRNDTLSFRETYSMGKFIEGITYKDGKEIPYTALEEQPTYIGGMQAMGRFLQKTMRYPPDARRRGIQGKVFVSFIVDKDGNPYDIRILKGVSPDIDNESLRVVKLMGRWNPGKQKGVPVRVRYVLPLNFSLG